MMLNTLKHLTPVEASGILSEAATKLVYAPPDEIPFLIAGLPDLEKNALNEIIAINDLAQKSYTPVSRDQLIAAIDKVSDELYNIEFNEKSLEGLEDTSLIATDTLSPVFEGVLFQNFSRLMKNDKRSALLTIKNPDSRELNRRLTDGIGSISLFAKVFERTFPAQTHILLVVSRQVGMRLHVPQYWRVYPGDVTISHSESLYDLYMRFISVFGIILDDKEKDMLGPELLRNKEIRDIYNKKHRKNTDTMFTFAFFLKRFNLEGHLLEERSITCGVDVESYIDSLSRKGAVQASVRRELNEKHR